MKAPRVPPIIAAKITRKRRTIEEKVIEDIKEME
jgi:hypothetical protein